MREMSFEWRSSETRPTPACRCMGMGMRMRRGTGKSMGIGMGIGMDRDMSVGMSIGVRMSMGMRMGMGIGMGRDMSIDMSMEKRMDKSMGMAADLVVDDLQLESAEPRAMRRLPRGGQAGRGAEGVPAAPLGHDDELAEVAEGGVDEGADALDVHLVLGAVVARRHAAVADDAGAWRRVAHLGHHRQLAGRGHSDGQRPLAPRRPEAFGEGVRVDVGRRGSACRGARRGERLGGGLPRADGDL